MDDSHEDRVVDLRAELPRLLATLSAEDAAAVEEALIAAALRDNVTSPSVARPVGRRIGTDGEYAAIRWQDLDLIEAAVLVGAAAVAANTVVVPIAGLVVALWKYRRKQIVLSAEVAQLLLVLKKAPTAGWTVDELITHLPRGLGVSRDELESRLNLLRTMRDASGREIPLVTVNTEKWRALDV